MIAMMLRLTKVVRSKINRDPAFRKVNGSALGLALVAIALFALAYVVEDKAIISLESSPYLFNEVPNQLFYH
jgi:hypothetical protein